MSNHSCPLSGREGAGLLLDYLDRRLGPDAAVALERHIGGCAECGSIVAAQREVWDALDAWRPVTVSEEFNDRLFARIAEEDRSPARRPALVDRVMGWFRAPVIPRLVPVAAMCLVLAGVFVYRAPEPSGHEPVVAEQVDVEHAEATLADVEMLQELEAADETVGRQAL